MAKPFPRPTAPPSPMQQAQAILKPVSQAPAVPLVTSVAFGRTASGRYAAAILKTQGRALVSCDLLGHPSGDAEVAADIWRDSAYPALIQGRTPRLVQGPPLVEGHAFALFTSGSRTAALVLVLEEGRVVEPVPGDAELVGGRRVLPTGGEVYTGRRLDAWQELELYAALHVLSEGGRKRKEARNAPMP